MLSRRLMPSTGAAYPRVISRLFASFHVVGSSIYAGQAILCVWFDSGNSTEKGRRDAALFRSLVIGLDGSEVIAPS
jgi:hypothetical protein